MVNVLVNKVSRRTFLKGSAAAAAGTAVVGASPPGRKVLKGLVAAEEVAQPQDVREFTVACPSFGCHQNCPLKATVVDGRVTAVRAADIPEVPENTHACVRGLASYQLPYLPQRLNYPMKRVGARGEDKWQRISWDEAYDTIATKIGGIRDRYGPQSVVMVGCFSSSVPLMGVNAGGMTSRFANVFGCSEVVGWPIDSNPPAAGLATFGGMFPPATEPLEWHDARLIIFWGGNPAEASMRDFKHALIAREKGAKLVQIGSRYDGTAAVVDQWVDIEPGTDGALASAMAHIIFERGLLDAPYLLRLTVAPLLVRVDSGMYLREADILDGGSADVFVVWDEETRTPVVVPAGTGEIAASRPALFGEFTVNGIRCKTALQMFREKVSEYTPEKASEITGIPIQVIEGLTDDYVNKRPAVISLGTGVSRYFHGDLTCRAILALDILTGNVPAGGGLAMMDPTPVAAPDMRRSKRLPWSHGFNAVIDEQPYPIKGLMVFGANLLNNMATPQVWLEQILPKLDFVVVTDIVPTWTARVADILLPGTCIYEREDVYTNLGCMILTQKAIEPLFERRSDTEIVSELAERLGMGELFTKSSREYVDMMIGTIGVPGIDRAALETAGGIVRLPASEGAPAPGFRTKTGRMEFYVEWLKPFGEEAPTYKPPVEDKASERGSKYPLRFLTARARYWTQSQSFYPLARLLNPEPRLRINPVDAGKRGIGDGERVRVFNDRGDFIVKAEVNDSLRPGSIWIEHGWWPEDFERGHYQNVIRQIAAPTPDMINHTFDVYWGIWQQIAQILPMAVIMPFGVSDQLFDCLVQVEKA